MFLNKKRQKRSGSRPKSIRNGLGAARIALETFRIASETVSVRAARQTSETVREPREKLSEIVWEPPEPQKRSRSEPLEKRQNGPGAARKASETV